jgi:hypothetical protein
MSENLPLNEGQETVAAFQFDLQMFADEPAPDAGGDVGVDTGTESDIDADVSDGDTFNDDAGSGTVDQDNDDDVPSVVKQQSPEADRAFAEMRKQKQAAERAAQQARDEIQRQRDAEYAKRFGKSHGIFTEAQYWAAIDRELQVKVEQQRRQQAELPNQIYQQLVNEGYDPRVAKGLAEVEASKMQLAQVQQQLTLREQQEQQREMERNQQAYKENLAKQIQSDHEALTKKYGKLVPSLDEMDDATLSLMRQGVPLKAAWLTAHEDEVIEFARTNGAKKKMRDINSKSHLQSEKSGAGDFGTEVDLSPGQIAAYRNLFGPQMTIAEMKKREAAFIKKRGK